MVTTIKRILLVACLAAVIGSLWSCAKPLGNVTGLGQNTVAVIGKVPVINLVDKPVLELLDSDELIAYNALPEKLRLKLQSNDKKLKTLALSMQIAIEDYNQYAAIRNQQSDASVGVKGGK